MKAITELKEAKNYLEKSAYAKMKKMAGDGEKWSVGISEPVRGQTAHDDDDDDDDEL